MKTKVLGILCSYGASYGTGLPNFHSLSNYLRDLHNIFSEAGWSVIVFRAEDILKRKQIVWGWSRSDGIWRRTFSPIPSVCLIRKSTLSKKDLEILKWIEQECQTKFINHPSLIEILGDRWRTNQILVSHPNLIAKTPDCFPLVDEKKLLELAKEKVGFVIRPRLISSPQKYIIAKFVAEGIKCEFFYKKKIKTIVFKSIESVVKTAKENIGPSIAEVHKILFESEGHAIGLRCLFVKDKTWSHQGSLLRVSRKKVVFGPFATVGTVGDYRQVLESFFGKSVDSVLFQAANTSRNVVELLDDRTQEGAKELSVDIVFSQSFEPVVFGVNSQGAIFSATKIGNPEFKKQILGDLLAAAEQTKAFQLNLAAL